MYEMQGTEKGKESTKTERGGCSQAKYFRMFQSSAGEVIRPENGNYYNNLMRDNGPDQNEKWGRKTKRLAVLISL